MTQLMTHLMYLTQFRSIKQDRTGIPKYSTLVLLNLSFMKLFRKEDDETPEDKLITTIKRAILSIQKEELEKAEKMLHLALRMAQDLKSKDGITYVYDAMANLAMERGQFEKAEKLFVDVMKRLFGDGAQEDDMRLLHISAKIAHMAQQSGQLEKAKQGFEWVINKLEGRMKAAGDDVQLKELWAMTKNWYAQTLMQLNATEEAKKAMEVAHSTYLEIHGKLSEEGLLLLNNLGVVCTQVRGVVRLTGNELISENFPFQLGELDAAEKYLNEAIELAKEFPDFVESAVFRANLGLVYLKKGLVEKAHEICTFTWRMGHQKNHAEVIEQSGYCLDQIKAYQDRNKM